MSIIFVVSKIIVTLRLLNNRSTATNIEKMKQILTKHGEVTAIARFLGCDRNTVTNALQGKYNTELAQRIRKIAVKRGGVEIEVES